MSLDLIAAAVALPPDRTPGRGGRRCSAPFDQDAVTLAAEAVLTLCEESEGPPAALLFASVTAPYEEGGSAQIVAELAGLPESTFCAELTATPRDGLVALRLAEGLLAAGTGPVLVCGAHRASAGERDGGDGAVALLLGASGGAATLSPGPTHTEELRDRWRLRGEDVVREADPSFTDELGAPRVAALLAAAARDRVAVGAGVASAGGSADGEEPAIAVCVPSARAAARVERVLGGPGDPAVAHTGLLGAAHPLLRIALAAGAPTLVVAASGGLGEVVGVTPGESGDELAASVAAQVRAGREADSVPGPPRQAGFSPYASAPRAWRERGQDLRLEGTVSGDRVLYPPPAGVAGERRPLPRSGTVITWTRDHVYPGADTVDMAVVGLSDGSRFYGQVTAGEEIAIDDPVRLVPRRLHEGGGAAQYYWKVARCR